MRRELIQCGNCEYFHRGPGGYGDGWCMLLPDPIRKRDDSGCYSGCKKEAERPFDGILRDHPLFEAKKNGD